DEQELTQAEAGRSSGDDERDELEGRLRLALQVNSGDEAFASGERDLERRVRRAPWRSEAAPHALVPSRRAALSEVREPEARHVRQEDDVCGDHHRGLSGPVRALERGDVAIELVALVEDAL